MQKNNKKATILIWSIVLSLMLGFVFIFLSNQINILFKQNIYFQNEIEIEKNFEKKLLEFKKMAKDIETNIKGLVEYDFDSLALHNNIHFGDKKQGFSKLKENIEKLKQKDDQTFCNDGVNKIVCNILRNIVLENNIDIFDKKYENKTVDFDDILYNFFEANREINFGNQKLELILNKKSIGLEPGESFSFYNIGKTKITFLKAIGICYTIEKTDLSSKSTDKIQIFESEKILELNNTTKITIKNLAKNDSVFKNSFCKAGTYLKINIIGEDKNILFFGDIDYKITEKYGKNDVLKETGNLKIY